MTGRPFAPEVAEPEVARPGVVGALAHPLERRTRVGIRLTNGRQWVAARGVFGLPQVGESPRTLGQRPPAALGCLPSENF